MLREAIKMGRPMEFLARDPEKEARFERVEGWVRGALEMGLRKDREERVKAEEWGVWVRDAVVGVGVGMS